MTGLSTKLERDQINIRCHEQALTYSALLLILANKATDNSGISDVYKTAVKLATNNAQANGIITSNILIEGKFPYSRQSAFISGGLFVDHVLPFSSYSPGAWLGEPLDLLDGDLGEDPDFCTTLERYFCFHALQWQRALIAANSTEVFTRCKISILDEASPEPSLSVSLLIPYSYSKYTQTRSLLKSVERLVSAITFGEQPYITDDISLTDNYYLTD